MIGSRDKPLILVVDDEAHILHVVSLKLRNAGFDVITAADGEEGYELAVEHMPDLVITDYQMPVMTGLELCLHLREHERAADLPAVMLTARGAGLSDDDLAQTRIRHVLTKPFSPREVLTTVQTLIDEESEVPA